MTSFRVCHGYALTIACKGENSLRLQNRRFSFFFLQYAGERRKALGERKARVMSEGRNVIFLSLRLASVRLKNARKILTPALQVTIHSSVKHNSNDPPSRSLHTSWENITFSSSSPLGTRSAG